MRNLNFSGKQQYRSEPSCEQYPPFSPASDALHGAGQSSLDAGQGLPSTGQTMHLEQGAEQGAHLVQGAGQDRHPRGHSSHNKLSRRELLRVLAGVGALSALGLPTGLSTHARADIADDIKKTEAELKKTQEQYEQVKKQLDVLVDEYEALSLAQSKTKDQIESVYTQLGKTQARIETQGRDLAHKQERLGRRVASAYKSGPTGPIDILLSASSFEELTANIYYLDKISSQDHNMIEDVKEAKATLEKSKIELEKKKTELEELSAKQEEQIAASQAKQAEVQAILNDLSEDVKALIAQRDAELLEQQKDNERKKAAAEAAEKARKEEEARRKAAAEAVRATAEKSAREQAQRDEAAQAAAASGSSSSSSSSSGSNSSSSNVSHSSESDYVSEDVSEEPEPEAPTYTGSASAVLRACNSTPSPGLGLCAGWVSNVFVNAGLGFIGGNANDMYAWYCYSSNRSSIQPGMIVAVSTHSHTSAGRIWGHVGIYIGGGLVMDNIGYIRTISLSEWVNYYGTTVTPRWGWLGGIVLS